MSGSPRIYSVRAYDMKGQPVYDREVDWESVPQEALDALTNLDGIHVGSFVVLIHGAIYPTTAAPTNSAKAQQGAALVEGSDSKTSNGGAGD